MRWRGTMLAISLTAAASIGLAGCTNPYDPGQRALGGAGLGAAGGALIGGAVGGGRGALTGALIGGATGAVAGAATTPPPPTYVEPEPVYVQPRARYRYYKPGY